MSAHLRLNQLINFLQAWQSKIPASAEIFPDPFSAGTGANTHLDSLRQASEELSEAFRTLQEVVDVVRISSSELAISYRTAQNSILPPMMLPFEILGSIFEMACLPSAEPGKATAGANPTITISKCRHTRLAIGASCSHFRQVLLNTPAVWSYISISMDYLASTRPSDTLIPLEVARGKSSPVYLYVFDERAVPSEASRYWETVKGSLYSLQRRLHTLAIVGNGSNADLPPLNFLSGDHLLPALKTLRITFREQLPMTYVDLRSAPALETFTITATGRSPPSILCHPISHIRELTIRGNVSVDTTLDLVASCHQSLIKFQWLPEGGSHLYNLPIPSTMLQLSQLQELYLNNRFPMSLIKPARFLMPNLSKLTLGRWTQIVNENFDLGTICLPSLRIVDIGGDGFFGDAIKPFFRANPTIREIVTGPSIRHVIQSLEDSDSTVDEILPNLDRISFANSSPYMNEALALFQLARQRHRQFRVVFEAIPRDFDNRLLIEYGDIMLIEKITPSNVTWP
ncbi:hypothetical protein DL93DRAFT_2084559 [Clavulina sp. PMI_390]|nr:hypothetical protein DL93DRAFT_2084559 [Clavulina sp. PMI_390]